MRSSTEIYAEVAERCSAYDHSCHGENCFSNIETDSKSCLNCKHFAEDEHCRLDLYDPIVKNLD